MYQFKSWRDIKKWCEENNFTKLAKRMQMNNDFWNSSGEFGRSQVDICDSIRFAEDENERKIIAKELQEIYDQEYC